MASGLYGALLSLVVCWPAWPGMMSYDSLFAYQEARLGVTSASWPPMHAYLFVLSRLLGADAWGVFLLQIFLLFFGGALIINLLIGSRAWAFAALAAYAAGFVYVPELLGSAIVQWRDVATTSFAVAGLAAWLLAARGRSVLGLVGAALLMGVAAALRYNTIVLIAPLMLLMAWRPFLGGTPPRSARIAVAMTLILGLGLAAASVTWRLPDLQRLPPANEFGATQEFDLLGISACSDRVWIPPVMTDGWPITPRQIRAAYDPRHLNRAFRKIAGAPSIRPDDPQAEVRKIWPVAVRKNLGCYLAHRVAVFVQQMGMARDNVFYPTNPEIAANPYGLHPAHPRALSAVARYISVRAPEIWRRPFLLYLLAPVVMLLVWRSRSPGRAVLLAVLAGAIAYAAALFFIGPAADARYIFPSSVFCVLLISAGTALVLASNPVAVGRLGVATRLRARPRRASLVIRLRWSRG